MSTEQEQTPSSPKLVAKKGNWFLAEDGTLKTQSWIVLIILAIIGIVGLIQLGYYVGWTGFQGKTLWDWMQLFLVSTVLGAGAYWFNSQQTTHQRTLADAQQKQEKELAEHREQATILETYLDRMKELLLDKGLRSDPEARLVARIRTLTTLRRLKGEHISMLFTFLQDARLNGANIESAIIDFQDADLRRIDLYKVELRKVDLSGADLREVDLREVDLSFARLNGARLNGAMLNGADLSFANLSRAWLRGINLSKADLHGANLSFANLHRSDLSFANLHRADLSGADLSFVDLSGADLREDNLSGAELRRADLSGADLSLVDLSGADLREANLREAKLRSTNLSGANLSRVKLHGTDLRGADLSGAKLWEAQGVTIEELMNQANSLEGATLPDGMLYQKISAIGSTEEVPESSVLDSVEEGLPEQAAISSDEESSEVPATD